MNVECNKEPKQRWHKYQETINDPSITEIPASINVANDYQLPDPPLLGKTTPPPRHKNIH